MGLDDKRWTMAVGKQHDSVLPSRQSLDVGSLIPRDFIPGYSRFALWRLPDALSHDGGWQTDVAAGDVIGPSRR